MCGINPDLDVLLSAADPEEPPIYCDCCRRPVTDFQSYAEIGVEAPMQRHFFFCQQCMEEAVEHFNIRYGP